MGKGTRRRLNVLPRLPEGREHPWERAGVTREDWLVALRRATKAHVASDERADAYFQSGDDLDLAAADDLVAERDVAESL